MFSSGTKKFLIGCGALSLILLVIGVIGFAILADRGTKLDKESSVYADAALKAICTDWSEKALLDRASPEFKQATPIEQLDSYFRQYAKLGHLQSAEPMKGQAGMMYHGGRQPRPRDVQHESAVRERRSYGHARLD